MIANPERQEVDLLVFDADGGQKHYIMKLSTTASVALEVRLKMKTGDILRELATFSQQTMRDVVHSMLQKYHGAEFPNTPKGIEAAGDLMDDVVGGRRALIKAITQTTGLADEEKKKLIAEGPNPLEAQVGTGDDSKLKLVESA